MPIPLAMGLIGPNGGRDADAARRRSRRAATGTRVARLRRAAAELPLRRCAGAAGAVAAARLLGAGEAQGRAARPAQVSGDPRHRSGRALGCRPAGRDRRAARPDRRAQRGDAGPLDPDLVAAMRQTLADADRDPAFAAEALLLPSEAYARRRRWRWSMSRRSMRVARDARAADRRSARRRRSPTPTAGSPIPAPTASTAPRSAGGRCATSASPISPPATRRKARGSPRRSSTRRQNMTDVLAALTVLADIDCPERAAALAAFYERWAGRPAGHRQMVRAAGPLVAAGNRRGGARADAATRPSPASQPEPGARPGRRFLAGQPAAISTMRAAPAMPSSPTR